MTLSGAMQVNKVTGIIGLDLSVTGAGIAILRFFDEGTVNIKTYNVGTKATFGNIEKRIQYIVDFILANTTSTDLVFIEDYAYGVKPGASSLATLAELGGVIKYIMHRRVGIWPCAISSTTIKQWLSGKGNIKKDSFLYWGLKKYGQDFKTGDEVVAHTIVDFAYFLLLNTLNNPKKFTKVESSILEKYRKTVDYKKLILFLNGKEGPDGHERFWA